MARYLAYELESGAPWPLHQVLICICPGTSLGTSGFSFQVPLGAGLEGEEEIPKDDPLKLGQNVFLTK